MTIHREDAPPTKFFPQVIFTAVFAFSTLVVSLFASWQLLAKIDFAYPQAYQWLDIDGHIAYYGPQNRFRFHFIQTDVPERQRLFAAINESVHNHGQGLADITYHRPDGVVIGKLLHQAEIIHLQDVANLIDVLWWVGIAALIGLLMLLTIAYKFRLTIAPVLKQLLALLVLIGLSTVVILLIGAEIVFHAMHVLVFPDNHQWYFFYQDSLMSTLMKAPDLFGVIAVEIVLLATAIFALLVYVARQLTGVGLGNN